MLPPRTWFLSTLFATIAFISASCLPAAVLAQTWNETGDAGDLPATAQATLGSGPLEQIRGHFAGQEDEDVYCIHITNLNDFFAGIVCSVMIDPDIWLFDPAGMGVEHLDTCSGGDTRITGLFVPATGLYYLAVALGGRQAQSPAGAIWQTELFTVQRTPDGPGAPGPVIGWAGGGHPTALLNYTINLGGATFCDTPTAADSRTWGTVKALYR